MRKSGAAVSELTCSKSASALSVLFCLMGCTLYETNRHISALETLSGNFLQAMSLIMIGMGLVFAVIFHVGTKERSVKVMCFNQIFKLSRWMSSL